VARSLLPEGPKEGEERGRQEEGGGEGVILHLLQIGKLEGEAGKRGKGGKLTIDFSRRRIPNLRQEMEK
jgi:hypothetical protein